eukprot:maker-scaffold594_size129171-snap-gene-0.18 protein:Tk01958 transcript:maker-scaffold594_size129171-snap-gene-0.18-mRNA-1 annotation:"GM24678"
MNPFIWRPLLRGLKPVLRQPVRFGGHATHKQRPTTWSWDIFKDFVNLYVILTGAPFAAAILYSNVFVGHANLQPIPEGYNPKEDEYHAHPIVRWLMRHFYSGEQQRYEITLHSLWQSLRSLTTKLNSPFRGVSGSETTATVMNPFIWRPLLRGLKPVLRQPVRFGGHATHKQRPTTWSWDIFKDFVNLYVILTGAPFAAAILYSNVFVGHANLQPIPEGYNPKEDEYHAHPIVRWLMRHFYSGEQQRYEITLHSLWQSEKRKKQRMLEKEVKRLIEVDGGYTAYFHVPTNSAVVRSHNKAMQKMGERTGMEVRDI